LLEQKETKIQANSPTSIFFSRKGLRNATEKIAVRSELAKQPHYYQRMRDVVNFVAPSLRFDVRRRSNLIPGLYNFFLIFFFFLLEQKETKIQANSPTSIFFSRKGLRNATEKIAVRSELAKQPHYYQRMRDVPV